MPAEIKAQWDTSPTDLTVTNLASRADGTVWRSGNLDPGNPAPQMVRVSYEIVFNATPVAGDYLDFRYASADEAASNEIIDGGIATTEGGITAAAGIAEAVAGSVSVKAHGWSTSHGTTFKGSFDIPDPGPSWQLLIRPVGEALAASGHRVRIRYLSPEYQG
jgi:hypothetical protein